MLAPIVPPPLAASARDPFAAAPPDREVAAQFEALLLRSALAPVAKAMGFYGDLVVDAAALRITRGIA